MDLNFNKKWKLNNGVKIPCFGLGTWRLSGSTAKQAVIWALEKGYRLIDTAAFYGNEREIGEGIKESGVNREEIFITTKVWQSDFGYESTLNAFETSLQNLGMNYIDLYLIHWPRDGRYETWKALIKLYEEEKVRAIGVSNYTLKLLEELLKKSNVTPAINQVEFSPFLYQKDLLEYCKGNNIQLEAYCPLTRGNKLNHPVIQEISKKYNKSTATILIRWSLQHQVIPIPKSGTKQHIYQNTEVFDFNLQKVDMDQLDKLNENFRVVNDTIFD
ncbi:MAG: aldo/keto reductase [Candidatus Lokiarchaeota archaeon]